MKNSVEILKGELWFPGSIISVIGDNYYVVRYATIADSEGEAMVEKVHKDHVRPKPPFKRGKRWMVGDFAQVFDSRCWRLGKIAKILKNSFFVIRLYGSIQLKQFHGSNLRICQSWHQNKWSKIAASKDSSKIFVQNKANPLVCNSPLEVYGKDSCFRKRDRQKYLSGPVRMTDLRLFRQGDGISGRNGIADEKFSAKAAYDEESDQCSVASCSSNDVADSVSFYNNFNKADNSDAESSYPSISANIHSTPSFEEKVEADVHELEFHAYKSIMHALYASGPLSWEQESLLTNLRLSLNISDEEHLLQLKHLLSSQLV